MPALQEMGFQAIFRPGATTADIIEFLRQKVPAAGGASAGGGPS
jgi:methylmalonyl-CoA mutase cobalamin-binding subunit